MSVIKRHTVQKAMTYQAVCDLANHPTAEEIYAKVKLSHPSISLGTVYRNLGTLCEEGLLFHIKLPGTADRYDHNVFFHSHISCDICGKVCDILLPYSEETDKEVKTQTGYTQISHDIVFKGLCPDCSNKQ